MSPVSRDCIADQPFAPLQRFGFVLLVISHFTVANPQLAVSRA
jgi:hypothetical protein